MGRKRPENVPATLLRVPLGLAHCSRRRGVEGQPRAFPACAKGFCFPRVLLQWNNEWLKGGKKGKEINVGYNTELLHQSWNKGKK